MLARDTARVEFNDIGSGRRETVPEYPVSVERVGGIVYDLPASKSVIKPLRAHEKFEGGEWYLQWTRVECRTAGSIPR